MALDWSAAWRGLIRHDGPDIDIGEANRRQRLENGHRQNPLKNEASA